MYADNIRKGGVSLPTLYLRIFAQEFSRPPIYNPEDYAASLRKWIGGGCGSNSSKSSTKSSEANVSSETVSNDEAELRLRQFLNISDSLNKLKTDLRLAYLRLVNVNILHLNYTNGKLELLAYYTRIKTRLRRATCACGYSRSYSPRSAIRGCGRGLHGSDEPTGSDFRRSRTLQRQIFGTF